MVVYRIMDTFVDMHSLFPPFQVKGVQMMKCRLTSSVSKRIQDSFESLTNVEIMEITAPTTVDQFPHLTTVRRLKFMGVPSDSNDWQWIGNLQELSDIEVKVRGTAHDIGCLHVYGDKAEYLDISEDEAVQTLVDVSDNLPSNMRNKVSAETINVQCVCVCVCVCVFQLGFDL